MNERNRRIWQLIVSKNKTNYLKNNNRKLKRDGIWSFNLPAKKTCGQAKECLKYCYADKGAYRYPAVQASMQRNWDASKLSSFVERLNEELHRKKPFAVRIHDSGDFYSLSYFKKWVEVASNNPSVIFYAYTKEVMMIKNFKQECLQKGLPFPRNFTIIFSLGGKQDNMISENNDRHAKIFDNPMRLLQSNYADTSTHDTGAFGNNIRVGLIKH
jgi:hypothetical protein